jgi:hypothetical protein
VPVVRWNKVNNKKNKNLHTRHDYETWLLYTLPFCMALSQDGPIGSACDGEGAGPYRHGDGLVPFRSPHAWTTLHGVSSCLRTDPFAAPVTRKVNALLSWPRAISATACLACPLVGNNTAGRVGLIRLASHVRPRRSERGDRRIECCLSIISVALSAMSHNAFRVYSIGSTRRFTT